jgi:hypothetical protein
MKKAEWKAMSPAERVRVLAQGRRGVRKLIRRMDGPPNRTEEVFGATLAGVLLVREDGTWHHYTTREALEFAQERRQFYRREIEALDRAGRE